MSFCTLSGLMIPETILARRLVKYILDETT